MIRIESGSGLVSDDGCAVGACVHTRRGFLRGATAAVATSPALAQVSLAAPASPRRIDIHHHCYPTKWLAAKRAQILGTSDQAPAIKSGWSPQLAIETMDKNGVATGVACVSNPGVWYGDKDEARGLQRDCNEYMAGLMRDHPGRFGSFASLALPDVDGCLREIEYAFDTLKVDGVQLFTSYGDKWPGDPAFDPVFAELNRRKAIVFIHPTAANCCGNLDVGVPVSNIEFPFDETRAIVSLIVHGVVSKYKEIRFIFTHAGGPTPVLVARMDQMMRDPKIAQRAPEGIVAAFRSLYFDVANSTTNPASIAAIMATAPASHIMFGTDFPYIPMEKTVGGLGRLGLAQAQIDAINRGNAAALLPKFA